MHIHQINFQPSIGGGEVFTRSFTKALSDAGAQVSLYVDPSNRFWDGIASSSIEVVPVSNPTSVLDRLPASGALVMTQSRLPLPLLDVAARKHFLTGFAHMPILNRSATEFERYSVVFTVSDYCIGLLRKAGIGQVYAEPVYGTYALDQHASRESAAPIIANSPYHWDKRKGRDFALSVIEPILRPFLTGESFVRRPGTTLGIVSLLSPIKQFPQLLALLAPHISMTPDVNLEIFGNGGYAQVRDIKKSLVPIANRVRFWGYQRSVDTIYPKLDYLLTGLPEKEALGLNVLEAQALGTPVLAPSAPPFSETVVDGKTGFLYRDPREDRGADFGRILQLITLGRTRLDPAGATEHIEKFSYGAMVHRAHNILKFLANKMGRDE